MNYFLAVFPVIIGLAAVGHPLGGSTARGEEMIVRLPLEDEAGERMLETWELQAISPFPKPVDPEQVGIYTWGKLGQALALFLLEREIDTANLYVMEACAAFRSPDGSLKAAGDFHWQGNLLFRIYALFSSESGYRPGFLNPESEMAIADLFWTYANKESSLDNSGIDDLWRIWGSENHHLMKASTLWSAATVLEKSPAYQGKLFDDGHTAAEHKSAWTAYFNAYLREHFGKGLWLEYASPTYLKYSMQGLYNFADFAYDDDLRNAATACLDLHWASWAIEQIEGKRGGAKIRSYSGRSSDTAAADSSNTLGWYYFGIGEIRNGRHPAELAALSSAYRPSQQVWEFVANPSGRDPYTVVSRLPGRWRLGADGEPMRGDDPNYYYFDPDLPGILRTTFLTEEFVMGSLCFEAIHYDNWCALSSQNQWQGVILSGSPESLIHVRTDGEGNDRSTYNAQRAVQKGGSMMIQALPRTHMGKYIWPLSIHFPHALTPLEENGWLFVDAGETFIAARAAISSLRERKPGVFTVKNRVDPVILQVASEMTFPGGFDEFKTLVKAQSIISDDNGVIFLSALDDCRLEIDLNFQAWPSVDGVPLTVENQPAGRSPYLNQKWGALEAEFAGPSETPLVISPADPRVPLPSTALW